MKGDKKAVMVRQVYTIKYPFLQYRRYIVAEDGWSYTFSNSYKEENFRRDFPVGAIVVIQETSHGRWRLVK